MGLRSQLGKDKAGSDLLGSSLNKPQKPRVRFILHLILHICRTEKTLRHLTSAHTLLAVLLVPSSICGSETFCQVVPLALKQKAETAVPEAANAAWVDAIVAEAWHQCPYLLGLSREQGMLQYVKLDARDYIGNIFPYSLLPTGNKRTLLGTLTTRI